LQVDREELRQDVQRITAKIQSKQVCGAPDHERSVGLIIT
jgi:hypothetical protein